MPHLDSQIDAIDECVAVRPRRHHAEGALAVRRMRLVVAPKERWKPPLVGDERVARGAQGDARLAVVEPLLQSCELTVRGRPEAQEQHQQICRVECLERRQLFAFALQVRDTQIQFIFEALGELRHGLARAVFALSDQENDVRRLLRRQPLGHNRGNHQYCQRDNQTSHTKSVAREARSTYHAEPSQCRMHGCMEHGGRDTHGF